MFYYKIYFTYDGKQRECQLKTDIDYSKLPMDEEVMRFNIETYIDSQRWYKEGEIVTDAKLCDAKDNFICDILPFKAITHK